MNEAINNPYQAPKHEPEATRTRPSRLLYIPAAVVASYAIFFLFFMVTVYYQSAMLVLQWSASLRLTKTNCDTFAAQGGRLC